MKEEWKSVPNFSRYLVSNKGRVISTARSKVKELIPQNDAVGYVHVRLYPDDYRFGSYEGNRGKKPKLFKVHRLVLDTFFPNADTTLEVNHRDGNKKNNDITNLEWISRQENLQHAWATGLMKDAAYKAAKKRRKACKLIFPDGTYEYFESRVHLAIAYGCSTATIQRKMVTQEIFKRAALKGCYVVNVDELPPSETFKKILNIEKKLMEFNDRIYPNRKVYMARYRAKNKYKKKLSNDRKQKKLKK